MKKHKGPEIKGWYASIILKSRRYDCIYPGPGGRADAQAAAEVLVKTFNVPCNVGRYMADGAHDKELTLWPEDALTKKNKEEKK